MHANFRSAEDIEACLIIVVYNASSLGDYWENQLDGDYQDLSTATLLTQYNGYHLI